MFQCPEWPFAFRLQVLISRKLRLSRSFNALNGPSRFDSNVFAAILRMCDGSGFNALNGPSRFDQKTRGTYKQLAKQSFNALNGPSRFDNGVVAP